MIRGLPVSAIGIFHRSGFRNVTHVVRPFYTCYRMAEITGNSTLAGCIKLAAIMGRQLAGTRGNRGMTGRTENIGRAISFTMGQLVVILIPFVLPCIGMHRPGPLFVYVIVTGKTVAWIFKRTGRKLLLFDNQLICQRIIR